MLWLDGLFLDIYLNEIFMFNAHRKLEKLKEK